MNQRGIVGIIVLAIGAIILLVGGGFTSRHEVLRMGDVSVTANEHRTVPPWVGGAVMVVGVVLIVTGMGKRA